VRLRLSFVEFLKCWLFFRNLTDPNALETVFNTTWSSVWSTQAVLSVYNDTVLNQCVTFTPPSNFDLHKSSLHFKFINTNEHEDFVI
jgi:hypothetical protein